MSRKSNKTYGLETHSSNVIEEAIEMMKRTGTKEFVFSVPKLEILLQHKIDFCNSILVKHKLDAKWTVHIHKKATELHEEAFHAVNTLAHCSRVKNWINENNLRMAVTEAIFMMESFQNLVITIMEPDIYRGREQLNHSSNGGLRRSGKFKSMNNDYQERANYIWAENPQMSILEVANRVAEKTGKKANTIRRKIKKP